MNNLQIFKNDSFGEVRTLIIDNEPWFVGKDVASILGYAKPLNAISTHIDEDDSLKQGLIDNMGRTQETILINESGLYSLILSSKLPKAKEFKRWVTSEVLPSIRKTGGYTVPKSPMELLELEFQALREVENKVDVVNSDLQELKNNIPLFAVECDELTHAVNCKIISMLGGKDSIAYKDNHFRGKVYSDLYKEIKRQFGVRSYKAIKRCEISSALEIIKAYSLPIILQQELGNFSQMSL